MNKEKYDNKKDTEIIHEVYEKNSSSIGKNICKSFRRVSSMITENIHIIIRRGKNKNRDIRINEDKRTTLLQIGRIMNE